MAKDGFRITNLEEVVTMFELTDKYVSEATRVVLKEYAKKIKDTAKAFAPVDEHRLEKAIKVLPPKGNQYMLRIVIAVGGSVAGRDVDEYAAIVHEYPWSKRGPLTVLKGPRAGPRYLVRAIEEHRVKLTKALEAVVAEQIGHAVERSKVNVRKPR